MSKLASRAIAVVGDIVDSVIFWFDNTTSTQSWQATWLVIRTKLETYFPTRAEVTAEIALAVAGLYDHKGAYNASTNTPDLDTSPSGIKKSDAYTVSVAGNFYAVAVAAGDVLIADQDNPTASTHWTIVNRNIDEALLAESLLIAIGDELSNVTTGDGKVTFRMPYAFTLTGVRANVNTAPTGANIVVDIKEAGVSVLSTPLSIDATEKTSTTAGTPAVISDANLADDSEITIDVDQVGSTIPGKGLKITLIGTRL